MIDQRCPRRPLSLAEESSFSCIFRAFSKKKSDFAFFRMRSQTNKLGFFTATSFDGYEPEGREFESPRARHSFHLPPP